MTTTEPTTTESTTSERQPLTRERIIQAAVDLADEHGLEALSMRKLGSAVGVEAMSLYNHVSGKEDILDSMVEYLFDSIGPIDTAAGWQPTIRSAALAAKRAFASHPWSITLITTRQTLGDGSFAVMDAMIGMLLAAGYPTKIAHHAWHAIASHVMGYAFQEINSVFGKTGDPEQDDIEGLIAQYARQYPNLAAIGQHLMGCSYDEEFEFGLDLILTGIAGSKPTT
jgi:AcrR family transcriptional regulator